jgi:ATP-dependent DNA ligase
MGKVGTGWSRTISSQIRKRLDTVVSPKSKLTKPIRKPKATWVEPTFVADIADSGDCGQGFRLNATMHSDRRRPPVPTKAAGVWLPA